MKSLWNYIENKNWKAETKYFAALAAVMTLSGLAGLAVWVVLHALFATAPVFIFCFIGYPAVISCYIAILYLFRHEFQTGVPQE